MLRRVGLFILTNIAIVVLITITFTIIEKLTWIPISTHSGWYLGMFIGAMIIGFMGSFLSLMISRWMAKRAYKVKVISTDDISTLNWKEKLVYKVVEELSSNNNIKIPEVWIYEDNEPNAFATWATKNSALVAVSTWLLDRMSDNEIEWVVAHEMAHILNWDMVTMALLQWVLNTFVIFIANILTNLIDTFLSWNEEEGWLWFWARLWVNIGFQIVLWALASIILMWFSRVREFRADEWSAKYVWKEKMISALKALQRMKDLITTPNDDKLATMKIWSKDWNSMFSSHPSLELRIKALEENPNL